MLPLSLSSPLWLATAVLLGARVTYAAFKLDTIGTLPTSKLQLPIKC
jgi:hypothetical protein